LLSLIGIKISTGDESHVILNYLMDLKKILTKSNKDMAKSFQESENNFKVSNFNFENSIKFHDEKQNLYKNQFNIQIAEVKSFDEVYKIKTHIRKLFKKIKSEYELDLSSEIKLFENEINILKIKINEIENSIKGVLNENVFPKQKGNDDNKAGNIYEYMLKKIANNNNKVINKELIINFLYSTKSKLENKLNSLEKKYLKLNTQLEVVRKINLNIPQEEGKELQIKNKNKTDFINSLKSLIKFHEDLKESNKNQLEKLKSWWTAESKNFSQTDGKLNSTLKSLNKVKTILINNLNLLKEYLENR
jgi:hypothetical protein